MTIFTVNWWSTQPKELLYILKNKLKLAIYEYVGKGGSNRPHAALLLTVNSHLVNQVNRNARKVLVKSINNK